MTGFKLELPPLQVRILRHLNGGSRNPRELAGVTAHSIDGLEYKGLIMPVRGGYSLTEKGGHVAAILPLA